MATTSGATSVRIAEEKERDQVKRTGRFLLFFPTEWWETVAERHIGNDLHIRTTKQIHHIYLNGKQLPL